jgi:hypothetical protein
MKCPYNILVFPWKAKRNPLTTDIDAKIGETPNMVGCARRNLKRFRIIVRGWWLGDLRFGVKKNARNHQTGQKPKMENAKGTPRTAWEHWGDTPRSPELHQFVGVAGKYWVKNTDDGIRLLRI